MKVRDYSMKVGKGWGRINYVGGWEQGEVITEHGIVSVYIQGDSGNFDMTRIDFVHKSRLYCRSFRGKKYTPRGVVIKAKQFIEEIINQEQEADHEAQN